MKITSLILKNNRVQVFIDDKYAFSCTQNFVVDNRLHKDQELKEEEFEELKRNAQKSIIEYKLMDYASRRPYSPFELKTKINNYCKKRFDFIPEDNFFDKVLEKVKNLHLYNESENIRLWVQSYLSRSKSKNYIKSKLMSKRFDKNSIEEYLSKIKEEDIDDNLRKILQKKFNSLKDSEKENVFELKQKLYKFAAAKGFSFGDIKRIVEEII